MTREVAEKIVRGITDKIECNTADIDDWAEFWGFTREEYEEFLDMAIKALEQEPNCSEIPTGSDDCISRAEAQTEIEMNASRYTIAKERCGMGQVEWSDQLIKVSDAVDIIRHLPPATPQEPILNKLKEKDEAKAVRYEGDGYADGAMVYDMAFCPNCEHEFEEDSENWECDFCPNCGQRLRWKNDND